MEERTYTVFEKFEIIAKGNLEEVILFIKKRIGTNNHSSALIFDDTTGRSIDFDLSGTLDDVKQRLAIFVHHKAKESTQNLGPGRPKLGVVSREVSLLPKHWEWLALQSGGASLSLRKLVDMAIKDQAGNKSVRFYQDALAHFMSSIAGDCPHYEEATRALYRKDKDLFFSQIASWPKDLKTHIKKMSVAIFTESTKSSTKYK
ncbi:MAG: DUF2239 family protein [Oligoflexia bacterium]|nr:DUF2239 family protein [Oligoflexia bacterium]MBF0364918.1 DUF2239 family protein [Oligoflexia bacterium]